MFNFFVGCENSFGYFSCGLRRLFSMSNVCADSRFLWPFNIWQHLHVLNSSRRKYQKYSSNLRRKLNFVFTRCCLIREANIPFFPRETDKRTNRQIYKPFRLSTVSQWSDLTWRKKKSCPFSTLKVFFHARIKKKKKHKNFVKKKHKIFN